MYLAIGLAKVSKTVDALGSGVQRTLLPTLEMIQAPSALNLMDNFIGQFER
jgi:hypothetical protein